MSIPRTHHSPEAVKLQITPGTAAVACLLLTAHVRLSGILQFHVRARPSSSSASYALGPCCNLSFNSAIRPAAQNVFAGLSFLMTLDYSKLDGLVPAVIQDHSTGRVLMVGFMNEEAFRKTVESGYATFFSRSRNKLWLKGESSGHRLAVKEISTDCDQDCVLVKVESLGPGVCHEGYESCFFRQLKDGEWVASEERAYDPGAVYGGTQ